MVDQSTQAFADNLQGSHDCPDQIVLTNCHRLDSSASGFRYWWRQLYSDDENPDKTHLLRCQVDPIGGSKLTRTNTISRCWRIH